MGFAESSGDPHMQTSRAYVLQDEHGVLRVGDTRVMLDSVVAAFHQGHSAETIAQQYPALSLEEVYGAIAYYLANRADVDQYLRRQDELWKQGREQTSAAPSPVVQRLRGLAARTGLGEGEAPSEPDAVPARGSDGASPSQKPRHCPETNEP
jgi:uncharacterized protein (DUF433 family)